ncbi:hypothetical protein GCWU000282_01887 [Catonella morbi ATCC 51271]|uniref:Putative Se/S carrier protein-like domain-containing protein n=1 Tax=Catonella morbi ATCC 51271 TaxID=592026 RepID=V2XLF2_9FIRM|nr:DUF3343 domain-containing protein [Catonella morbi]ESL03014.1 hypothetical protein GCWU000282_01887 [Catonella morbi ATCC 51271]
MKNYYILFANYTEGLLLHDLLKANGHKARISPTPRTIQGSVPCGMSLLVKEEDIEGVKACIEENKAVYHDIVETECLIKSDRNKFC